MEIPFIEHTKAWIDKIVIGYNLCPFARHPFENGQIKYVLSTAETEELLIRDFIEELLQLTETSPDKVETTLIIHPFVLTSFQEYNAFAGTVELIIEELDFTGIFQLAEFHPDYQFAGTMPNDAQNYTNRSPYPMLHLLREDSVEKAVNSHPDVHSIPAQNIKTMEDLGREKILKILREITSPIGVQKKKKN